MTLNAVILFSQDTLTYDEVSQTKFAKESTVQKIQ